MLLIEKFSRIHFVCIILSNSLNADSRLSSSTLKGFVLSVREYLIFLSNSVSIFMSCFEK